MAEGTGPVVIEYSRDVCSDNVEEGTTETVETVGVGVRTTEGGK